MLHSKVFSISSESIIQVTISGTIDPTLIFLHFWGGSSCTFAQVTSILSPYYRCIAVDFRGWGASTGPQNPDRYRIQDLAQDIEALILELDIKDVILVGHSMGGKVAQLIAGRGRVKELKGVVLIAPAPPTPLELPSDMKEQQLVAYSSPQSAEFVIRNVLSSSKLDKKLVSMLVGDMMRGNDFAKAAWPAYGMAEDILTEAKKIDIPVLVIAAQEDRVETIEKLQKEVMKYVKTAEMVVVEASGHLLPVEAPVEVSRLVREFVERIGG